MLKPVRKQSLSDAVFDRLLSRIVVGELHPGSQLPGERALGEALGVNRGAIREALKRLEQVGLVSIHHGGGTRVLDYRASAALDVLPEICIGAEGVKDLPSVRGIIELRNAVSPDVARLAAERGTVEQFRSLREKLREHERAVGTDNLARAAEIRLDMWCVLAEASGNIAFQLLMNTVNKIHVQLIAGLVSILSSFLRNTQTLEGLVAAVERRDGETAAGEARRLIHASAQLLLEGLHDVEQTPQQQAATSRSRPPQARARMPGSCEGGRSLLKPIRKQSLSDAVFDQLLSRIVVGELPAGSQLPGERALGETLGVNRGAIREALKRLEQVGLVSIHHGGGTRILDYRASATLDILPSICVDAEGVINLDPVRGIIELRDAFTPDVARLAAERGTVEQFRSLREKLREEKRAVAADDLTRAAEIRLEIWSLLAEATDNIAFQLVMNTVNKMHAQLIEGLVTILSSFLRNTQPLEALVAAIERRDGESAAHEAKKLIHGRAQLLLESLDDEEQSRHEEAATAGG